MLDFEIPRIYYSEVVCGFTSKALPGNFVRKTERKNLWTLAILRLLRMPP
jgi:hypothetical protein